MALPGFTWAFRPDSQVEPFRALRPRITQYGNWVARCRLWGVMCHTF
jgi:hypothetical protein